MTVAKTKQQAPAKSPFRRGPRACFIAKDRAITRWWLLFLSIKPGTEARIDHALGLRNNFLRATFLEIGRAISQWSVRAWRKDRPPPALADRAYLNSISLIVDCRHCLRCRFLANLRAEAQRGPVSCWCAFAHGYDASRLYRVLPQRASSTYGKKKGGGSRPACHERLARRTDRRPAINLLGYLKTQ